MTAEPPHILILTLDGDLDPDEPLLWDFAELVCPHQPMRADVPCAVLTACGCAPGDGYDEPCPTSPTGVHTYWEDEPMMPTAECWAVHHADGLNDAALGLWLGPGRHEVWPQCDDCGRMDLIRTPPAAGPAQTAAAIGVEAADA